MINTKSCVEFITMIQSSWDSINPWAYTSLANELSDVDQDALKEICEKNNDDYRTTNYQVLKMIINHYNNYVENLYKQKGISK
ncbi:hypothetical protein EBU24_04860 [bacterium]|nr:hypothetical protein [bacterium]